MKKHWWSWTNEFPDACRLPTSHKWGIGRRCVSSDGHAGACSYVFSVGYGPIQRLREVVKEWGASEAELASIERLAEDRATLVDIERLAPLASRAHLSWDDMFPELTKDLEP